MTLNADHILWEMAHKTSFLVFEVRLTVAAPPH